MIPIYIPYLPKHILKYSHEAINSSWISSIGKYKNMVEEKLKEIFGIKYIILTHNGTSANHLIVKALKYKHSNINKIYAPDNVYIAVWNSLLYDKNNWKIDIQNTNPDTWNANFDDIENNKNNAIMIVHNLGNIIDVKKIKKRYPDCKIIEDNCEGLFGKYGDDYSGTKSLCSSISFFANKNITSGEGGAILTNDEEIYLYINKIHAQGQTKKRYVHDEIGYNYRMTNIQASLLYGQLKYLDEIIENKKRVFDLYKKELKSEDNIKLQKSEDNTIHSNWMFGIYLNKEINYQKKEDFFKKNGIEIRPFFYPIYYHNHLKYLKMFDKTSEDLSNKCFMLPSYPTLKNKEIKFICNKIKELANE